MVNKNNHNRRLYLGVYDTSDSEEKTIGMFRLEPKRKYTIGKESLSSDSHIQIDVPFILDKQAEIYVPMNYERINDENDFIIYTNLGTIPTRVKLHRVPANTYESRLIELCHKMATHILDRRGKDLSHNFSIEIHPSEGVEYGNLKLILEQKTNL